MKTMTKLFGSLFLFCLLACSARAAILMQEDFNYTDGTLTSVSGGNWTAFSGSGVYPVQISGGVISFTNVASGTSGEDDKRDFSAAVTNGTLYLRALVTMTTTPPSAKTNGDYFLALYSTNSSGGGYAPRIFVNAQTDGGWSFGMTNSGSTPVHWGADLSVNTTYQLFVRYNLATRTAAFGVFDTGTTPTEDQLTVTSPASTVTAPITSIAIRQGSSALFAGIIDSITVGTSFSDIDGTPSAPIILVQPQDATNFEGGSMTFSNVATGDLPLFYQWYYNTNTPLANSATISGATNAILVLTSLTTNQSGTYSCVLSNSVGTNVTRFALLTVSPQPVPPTIDTNTTPVGSTNVVGDTVTFSVAAHGLPSPAYQWKFIPDTNTTLTLTITGATSASLTLANLTTNQSGKYFATLTNASTVGYTSTNSAQAVLLVIPPPAVSIAQFRSGVDASYAPTNTTAIYTIQGTVTSWTNMTSSANTEFYMQDGTAGICVFWSGAAKSNLPPAGAIVRVTGPMAAFGGLLEIEPVYTNALHSVTIISTNNPLPAPQPLPFDPNITGDAAVMKALESGYFVASNVTLTAGATFTSGANEPITANASNVLTTPLYGLTFTNQQGQTFVLYVNSYTDIPGKGKPAGPVTLYGVLGYYSSVGYEFTPTRYADVISYLHVTNVLSNLPRPGDQPTNTFTENFLLPGGTLTTTASIGDPAGGSVTLTPLTDGLPAGAGWSDITNGVTGAATFRFTPSAADAGSNYAVNLRVTSTAGTAFTNSFTVYVPDANEQKICISEFLANPATNAAWPGFNPLHRSTDTTGISTNDQYIEIVNLSGADVNLVGWDIDKGSASSPIEDFSVNGPTLSSLNAIIIYGGNTDGGNTAESVSLPVYSESASSGKLALPTGGKGTLILRNSGGCIVDRVVYNAAGLSTNGSLSRFPTANGPFVAQACVGTNAATAGLQYDGRAWSLSPQIPKGLTDVVVGVTNNQAVFHFTATPDQAATLWSAGDVTGPFSVISGRSFSDSTGAFSLTNLPPARQFYFITTQTNSQ